MPSNSLILGSQSPRRKQLLEEAGFKFRVETIDFDEVFPQDMPVHNVAEYLATEKNKAFRKIHKKEIVLTADTVVIVNNKILGKPKNEDEAINMLSSLSGIVHQVVTGICISNDTKQHSTSVTTEVKVKPLSIKEINHYISNFSPFDKAGAYGIQEWFGLVAVEWVKGSYYNVVGLPVDKVYNLLTEDFDLVIF